MAWLALTKEHVEARMSIDEIACIGIVGSEGKTIDERLAPILEQITYMVRGKVSSCFENTLEPGAVIPEETLFHAVTLAKSALRATLPSTGIDDTELRKKECEQAEQFFRDVAVCKVGIDSPHEPEASEDGTSTPSFGSEPQHCF